MGRSPEEEERDDNRAEWAADSLERIAVALERIANTMRAGRGRRTKSPKYRGALPRKETR